MLHCLSLDTYFLISLFLWLGGILWAKVGSKMLLYIVQSICRSLGQTILRVTGSENNNEKKSNAVDSGHNILHRVSKERTRTSLGSI